MVFLLALAAALLMGAADAEALTRVVVSDTGEELWVALPNVVRHNPRARRLSSTSTPTPAVRANGTHAADDHAPNACDAQPGGGHGAAPAHNDHTDGLFFLFVVSCTLGYMWRKLESILSHGACSHEAGGLPRAEHAFLASCTDSLAARSFPYTDLAHFAPR